MINSKSKRKFILQDLINSGTLLKFLFILRFYPVQIFQIKNLSYLQSKNFYHE
jgi:hypothetical protein